MILYRYQCTFCKIYFWTDRQIIVYCPFCAMDIKEEPKKEEHQIKETDDTNI